MRLGATRSAGGRCLFASCLANAVRESLGTVALAETDLHLVANVLMHKDNQVQALELDCCRIDSLGAKILARALQHENNKVTKLNLGNNKLGERGAKAIAGVLQHENNHIRHLDARCGNAARLTRVRSVDHYQGAVSQALGRVRLIRGMFVLLSAAQVRRLGTRSALRRLPGDLIRLVGQVASKLVG
ncbi:hypothetical protein BASA81_010588 [Batrachochytrium salamandrivorans]|nr:hypothetical protein BASA81_010588 [Batrachochytrium salamandrivorans]